MAKYALCVGINDYPGRGQDLAGCVGDAKDLREFLTRRGYQPGLLLDGAARTEAAKAALELMAELAVAGDEVFVGWSSHGAQLPASDESDGYMGALVTHDFDWAENTGLTDDWMRGWLASIRAGVRVFVWLDTCFCGEFDRGYNPANEERAVRFLAIPDAYWAKIKPVAAAALSAAIQAALQAIAGSMARRFCGPRGGDAIQADVIMACACQPEQTSSECFIAPFGRRGAFTLRALAAREDLRNPTYREWMAETAGRLAEDGFEQVPLLFGLGPKAKALLDEIDKDGGQ